MNELIEMQCIDFHKLLLLKGKSLSLSDEECHILLIMLTLHELGLRFITPDHIARYVSYAPSVIDEVMINLINQHFIERRNGVLDFTPLYRKLLNEEKQEEIKEINLVDLFEDAFGRGLSATEIEFINDFKRSGFDDEMISDALKEAVKSNVLKFRYIEKILDNWKKYGKKIRNKPEVEEDVSEDIKNFNWWES